MLAIIGCQPDSTRNTATTNTEANSQSNINTSANNAAATSSADTASTGSLATPTEAYKTAWAYRKNKDIAGLKRVMSKDVLDFLTEIGKGDKKSLDDMLMEMTEEVKANTPEYRNEKINGDRATIEYKDDDGTWKPMDFVKEGNDWKLTLPEKGSLESEPAPMKKP